MNIAPRVVVLARGDRLVFDVHDDEFRVAFYSPKPGGVGEDRRTARGPSLVGALAEVFADSRHEERLVADYIRSAPFGRDVPADPE